MWGVVVERESAQDPHGPLRGSIANLNCGGSEFNFSKITTVYMYVHTVRWETQYT